MTISSTTTKVSYAGNGSTTVFAYTFKIFTDADLEVIVRSSTGTETTKTLTTDYTVSGVGSDGGGNVTFVTAPASGETVVIRRNLALTQGTDYVENDPFPADSHENALDRLTIIAQGIQEELDRAVKGAVTDATSVDMTLPPAANRASKFLLFDASGDVGVASTDTLTVSTLQAFSDYQVDTFTGDNTTVAFTLSAEPGQKGNTQVYFDGVYQAKANYSLVGTTITFTTAPPTSVKVEVVHGQAASTFVPDDGSITFAKLATAAVDTDLTSVSGSHDTLPSAKATKTYVDAQIGASNELSEVLTNGNTSGGTNIVVSSGDVITTNTINETTAASGVTIDSVLVKDGEVDGRDVSTDGTKLDTIETNADVTDTANVTAAGALMDSELSDIAAVKALNQGVATTDTPTFAGLVTAGNVDGRDVSADGAKLDGIEAGADVTEATNVTAAGALMDSELTSITAVKALNQGVATTDGPSFTDLTLSGGNLLFSSAAKGVYLGVTSATAANLLDDYEEGDWTPTIGQGATASSDATYNASFTGGQYTKTGRIVHCTATLRLTDKGTQSGAISVCGLPFASDNNVKFRATWSCWFHGAADIDLTGNTNGTIMLYQAHNTSHILVRVKDPATAAAENVEFADISDTVYLQLSGSYVAA